MRKREEIEKEWNTTLREARNYLWQPLFLELLLDIRELLQTNTPKQ